MKVSKKMETLKSYIDSKGLKSTSQRDFIAETFFKSNTHISLDELLKKVKRKTPNIGYATVYRTMKLLTEGGLAISRQFGDGQTRYENLPEDGHHDHLICIKCSRITEFQNQRIEQLQSETAKKHGFTVINHKLELYGYCSECM
ncbi:MAG TPA: transcriptional repressor [Thermodesulfobacteriota bacterium]|nr:transcriptional repressor [Thermodesulfobacteriota bacterium]